MPQIWLTYDELADYFAIPDAHAYAHVEREGWTRRRSRDGLVRIKLEPAAAIEYMRAVARAFEAGGGAEVGAAEVRGGVEARTDEQVALLRAVLEAGRTPSDPPAKTRAA